MHWTIPHRKELSHLKVNSEEVEKHCYKAAASFFVLQRTFRLLGRVETAGRGGLSTSPSGLIFFSVVRKDNIISILLTKFSVNSIVNYKHTVYNRSLEFIHLE